jgi:bacteriocin-like protein
MNKNQDQKKTKPEQKQIPATKKKQKKEKARELTDQELAKVSGGEPAERDYLEDLQVQRSR